MIAARAFWLLIPLLMIAAACGGGDSTSSTSTPAASSAGTTLSSSPEATGSAHAVDDLCPLLPQDDVHRTTGYNLLLAQFHNGPGPLHFCTVYLDIPDCQKQCALSLQNLGPLDPSSYNTPDAFKDSLVRGNSDVSFTFQDGTFGSGSWLATAQSGPVPEWKVAYFQVNGVAFDLHSPLVPQYALTEMQLTDAAKAVIANLNK